MASERTRTVYATADGTLALRIDAPFGLVLPPTLDLHRPFVGTVTFYWAEGHGITVAPDALTVSAQGGGR